MRIRATPDAIALSSLLGLGAALAAWSWLTWPDLLVDFGREAYVAWRIAAGDVLYRDLAYLNGPLSPHWNSLLMRAGGAGLSTLYLGNALVLMALLVLLQRVLTRLADRGSAWAANVCFLLVFAFARYVYAGNYNYLAPYSHEATHGLLLCLMSLACVGRADAGRARDEASARRWTLAAGLLLGAVALTKVELLVALLPAVILALALAAAGERATSFARLWRPALALGAAAFVVGLAWLLLAVVMRLGAGPAFEGLFGGLAWALDPRLTGLPFYRWGAGLDDPPGNLLRLLAALAAQLALLSPGLVACWLLRGRGALLVCTAGGAVLLAWLLLYRAQIAWLEAARPLPVYMLALLAWRSAPLLRRGASPELRARARAELPWIVFAGLLLAKLGLNARIYHYGFVLALPATLLVVLALLAWLPQALERLGRPGLPLRIWASSLLLAAALAHLDLGTQAVPHLETPLGSGRDRMLGDHLRGVPLAAALEELERRVSRDATLLVLPEGVMLSYLTRRPTPTPFLSFTPFDLIVWNERVMTTALRGSPPDAVLLLYRDTTEYGAELFGRDYGRQLAAWLRAGYRPVARLGDPPLRRDARFGVELWLPRPGLSPDGGRAEAGAGPRGEP